MSKKIFLFDDTGDKYEVYDIKGMMNDLLDEDVEMIYKSTRYFNELNLAVLELIDLGLMQKAQGEDYDEIGVKRGLEHLKVEIIERFGEGVVEVWDSEVDLKWKENKPDMSKYKK